MVEWLGLEESPGCYDDRREVVERRGIVERPVEQLAVVGAWA